MCSNYVLYINKQIEETGNGQYKSLDSYHKGGIPIGGEDHAEHIQ